MKPIIKIHSGITINDDLKQYIEKTITKFSERWHRDVHPGSYTVSIARNKDKSMDMRVSTTLTPTNTYKHKASLPLSAHYNGYDLRESIDLIADKLKTQLKRHLGH